MRVNIFWININESARVGIMPRPRGGDWLEDDVASLQYSGADVIVSLLEETEIKELDLEQEQSLCEAKGLQYISYQIPDRGIPLSRQETEKLIEELMGLTLKGMKIVPESTDKQ